MKKYLLMVNESMVGLLHHLMPCVEFLEVEGMDVQGANKHKILCSPIVPPVPMAEQPQQAEPVVQTEQPNGEAA